MPKRLIEAALFMSPRPLTSEELGKISGLRDIIEVERIVNELAKEYEEHGKAIEIIKLPDGWFMRVKSDILPKVAHLTPYSDLKDGHKRTLAIVAYKEPIKQSEIIKIQGNKAYGYIKFLEKKGLIKTEKHGRTKVIKLTSEFERYIGEQKEKIKEILTKTVEEV